ncbi:protein with signal peptide plus Thr stretch,possible mucin, related [Neospora caninum Liverpool]|uniref:Protein with signal peptide plus Thr stretch,possible mucin, related n=1 Tax=Neospora caninum (strain Liverpool) TaxID=572307 RepID=F0V851_NEOCL|nr:protein with signal peptide plus Thr stretch,possible mucin, related [Neospora caninum Liverpool]CBZ49892.1 protein with signal peptide plus Thr stretch,possible mucin, related [Neospora caninum Liverpool]CEL64479.1 TPA: Protein with signal peptide plus Thr stretch,possible mucin, related [Neospora caninum Liverpool]|eukprot:XP_003879927.1 protein with signal peptide plus Thr stretch,possible mucin, related [Neospora caninum Liverpool]
MEAETQKFTESSAEEVPHEVKEAVQPEGLLGRKTLLEQLFSDALKRVADAVTVHQSKVNFETEYLDPVEEELSVVMHAVELFQQIVIPPVVEIAKLPYEALRTASEFVDDIFRTIVDPEMTLSEDSSDSGLGSVDGSCDSQKTYNIRSTDDLQENRADLECIFARGEAPKRPPLGVVVGRVHEAGATDLYNLAMKIWWSGKLAFQTRCGSSRDIYMIQNLIHSTLDITAYAYIGTFADPLGPGEYMDKKPSLIYDYTVDFGTICPEMNEQANQVHLGVINNEHMYRNVVDVLRKVGETEDGGHILLGKAMLRDPLDFPENGDILAAFWSGVSYDHDAFESSRGDFRLGDLDRSFTYRHQSILEVLRRFLPLLELVADPTSVAPLLYDSALRWKLGREPLSPSQAFASRNYRMGGEPSDPQFRLRPLPSGTPVSHLSGALLPRVSVLDLLKKLTNDSERLSIAGVDAESQEDAQ